MVDRTPEQWRDYLLPCLVARRPIYKVLRDYYAGNHPLPTAPSTATSDYLRLARLGLTNMCGLIVDTVNQRLRVEGVRLSTDDKSDLGLWRSVWHANNLEADWRIAQEEALKVGRGPLLAWPRDPDNLAAGLDVTVEDADEVIVAYKPGNRRRRVASLKNFVDDDREYVTVWCADRGVQVQRAWWRERTTHNLAMWLPASFTDNGDEWRDDDDNSGVNPLGVNPVVELLSKPDTKGNPEAELADDVLSVQDGINKHMFDVVVAGESGAFPQRYGIGIQYDVDPVTKKALNPLTVGPNRVWILQPSSEGTPVSVGQLDPFPVDGLLATIDARIKHLASISQTPVYHLLSGLSNVGLDTVRMAEMGHVAKIHGHQAQFQDPAREIFRMALIAEGREVPDDIELQWATVQTRSPAEMADAAIKLSQSGYPFLALASLMGATPSEVERLEAWRAAERRELPVPPVPVAA